MSDSPPGKSLIHVKLTIFIGLRTSVHMRRSNCRSSALANIESANSIRESKRRSLRLPHYGRRQRAKAGPRLFVQDAVSVSPFLVIEIAPCGQVTDAIASPASQAKVQFKEPSQLSDLITCKAREAALVPWAAVAVCSALSPFSPWSPFGPGGPAGPACPWSPFIPCGPGGPCSPFGPCGPGGPCSPFEPVAPGGPGGPWSPLAPWGPGGPCSPLGPCWLGLQAARNAVNVNITTMDLRIGLPLFELAINFSRAGRDNVTNRQETLNPRTAHERFSSDAARKD